MTTFGVDTSLYQPLGSYDPGSFEIINALDPTLPQKVARNQAEGRPWGIYSWVFPGENGSYAVGRAIAALGKTGAAAAPLGFWWDYEDNGVVQSQLDQAFATSDAEGYYSGYYGNDYRFDHSTLLNRPYWMAAYPNPNDGVWQGWTPSASRPVQIWQWTSTNGTLDQNVVIDEAWYLSLAGGAPVPPETIKECDMYVGWGTDDKGVMFTDKIDGGITTVPFGGTISPYGFYQDGYDYADKYKVPFVLMSADEIAFARLRNWNERHPAAGGGSSGPLTVNLTGTATSSA